MINQRAMSKVCQLIIGVVVSAGCCGSVDWICPPWGGSKGLLLVHEQLCFFRSDFKMEWDEAESHCRKHGAILAKEKSAEISVFFSRKLLAKSYSTRLTLCFWIGLNDKGDAGNWKWSDGEKATYTHWGLYNGFVSWLEERLFDCAETCIAGKDADGLMEWRWNKERCGADNRFICQFDAVPVDVPTTVPAPATVEPARGKPKIPRQTRRKTVTQVIQVTNETGSRLTATPEWTTKAFTVTSCARRCQEITSNCQLFNYNSVTKQCLAFSTEAVIVVGRTAEKDWTLWKLTATVVY